MKSNFLLLLESQWHNKLGAWFSYLFTCSHTHLITYLRNKKKNKEIRYTYQFVNFETSIDKLLENNNINHTILLIYRAFSAH